jgi:hypothetical protein
LVHSSSSIIGIDGSTESIIQRMTEAIRKFIKGGEDQEGIPLSSVTKRHFQLQINTLQNAPRDAAKLLQIIKAKERKKNEKARHIYDIQRLVTEIEMLKFVLFLVSRNTRRTI